MIALAHIAAGIGSVAAICSTTSFLPQAVKIIRTREAKSLSTGMYVITVTGFAFWTAYGVLLGAWPLIASNGLCVALSAFILTMKLLPQSERDAVAETLEPVIGEDSATGGQPQARVASP